MTIFWRLLLSHLLADFTLQFNVVNRMKREGLAGMVIHCLTHFVVALALVWQWLPDVWFRAGNLPFNGWTAMVLLLVTHYMVDQLRVYTMRTLRFRDGLLSFLLDQFLHVYILFLLAPVFTLDSDFFHPEKWVGLLSMLVIVTHATTVLVYFIEKERHEKTFPGFDEKYFLIFERVVLWAFFLVKGWFWVPFAAAWIAQMVYVRKKRILDLSRTNIVVSVLAAVVCGLWARYIYYGAF
ncbi:MAG TPA: DUF3307 domain-containing protein [Elusimicrobiales bacterium]|nr:DUF3307 domain-containing protein [Elusimicrobiales bacterium]